MVLLTTSASLYRYNIGDVVRVSGLRAHTPVVEFLHRCGVTCSLTGEKLTEQHVIQAMNAVVRRHGTALEGFTLHPAAYGFPNCVLLIGPSGGGKARGFEAALFEHNIEYRAKRH